MLELITKSLQAIVTHCVVDSAVGGRVDGESVASKRRELTLYEPESLTFLADFPLFLPSSLSDSALFSSGALRCKENLHQASAQGNSVNYIIN